MMQKFAPVHPGEILREEFLAAHNLSQYRLAKDIEVSPRRINEIVHGTRAVTADTALRLGAYFGTSPRFWLQLQMQHDLARFEDGVSAAFARTLRTRAQHPQRQRRRTVSRSHAQA